VPDKELGPDSPGESFEDSAKPRVSVILPTFNRRNLAQRALSSVLRQTEQDFELFFIDDGSTDGTKNPEGLSPKIRYLRQENKGVAAARNLGIRNARGKWLAFLDSDDEWLPGKLEKQLLFHDKNPQFWISQTQEIWVRRGVRVNSMKKHAKKSGEIFEASLPLCLISPSCTLIRSDLLQETGLFDESFQVCEDYELWLRITARFPVGLVDEALTVKYGGHEDQLSKRYWGMDAFRIRAIVKTMKESPLTKAQKASCIAELRKKCRIYAADCLKRGRKEEAEEYLSLAKINGH